jgi:hypothetical protein
MLVSEDEIATMRASFSGSPEIQVLSVTVLHIVIRSYFHLCFH